MKWALVNPSWRFDGSIYFGCREPHLPLELGYARRCCEAEGHEVGDRRRAARGLSRRRMRARVDAFAPGHHGGDDGAELPVLALPAARAARPARNGRALRGAGRRATWSWVRTRSTTPATTLRKLGADAAVLGECEEVDRRARRDAARRDGPRVPSVAIARRDGAVPRERRAARGAT